MALMRLRPMRLTLLSPRGRFSLCLNSGVKYRVSVSQSPQLLAFDKTVVTYNNFPPQYLPLTITTCRPAFLTLVLPTSVNSICLRAFSTNRYFSRKSQNSESPFRKTEGTAPDPTWLIIELPLVQICQVKKKKHSLCEMVFFAYLGWSWKGNYILASTNDCYWNNVSCNLPYIFPPQCHRLSWRGRRLLWACGHSVLALWGPPSPA